MTTWSQPNLISPTTYLPRRLYCVSTLLWGAKEQNSSRMYCAVRYCIGIILLKKARALLIALWGERAHSYICAEHTKPLSIHKNEMSWLWLNSVHITIFNYSTKKKFKDDLLPRLVPNRYSQSSSFSIK